MLADLPPDQATDDEEFLARLGQFALLKPAERLAVLAARDQALRERLAHFTEMRALAGGDRWAETVTAELIRRGETERTWLTELQTLAADHDDDHDRPA
jgi:hypothetical protein